MNICHICGEPNAWSLIDSKYEFICLGCVESENPSLSEDRTGLPVYVPTMLCVGCRHVSGPANYNSDKEELLFFCGGSPRCCP